MSDLDHARQMLAIARRDLKALGGMLGADVFAYEGPPAGSGLLYCFNISNRHDFCLTRYV
jgi:hypothetical protein